MTTILDACALIIAGLERQPLQSARLAFAMARHAAVDLSRIFHLPPRAPAQNRLNPGELARLRTTLLAAGLSLREGREVDEKLHRLREMYEPYMCALGEFLPLMPLPPVGEPRGDAGQLGGHEVEPLKARHYVYAIYQVGRVPQRTGPGGCGDLGVDVRWRCRVGCLNMRSSSLSHHVRRAPFAIAIIACAVEAGCSSSSSPAASANGGDAGIVPTDSGSPATNDVRPRTARQHQGRSSRANPSPSASPSTAPASTG